MMATKMALMDAATNAMMRNVVLNGVYLQLMGGTNG